MDLLRLDRHAIGRQLLMHFRWRPQPLRLFREQFDHIVIRYGGAPAGACRRLQFECLHPIGRRLISGEHHNQLLYELEQLVRPPLRNCQGVAFLPHVFLRSLKIPER